MKSLPHAGLKRTPWKNGGGETLELAIAPPGAGIEAFDWRISMATIARDGPFSSFPGMDRTLCLMAGAGFELIIDGTAHAITPDSAPCRFRGDVPSSARLVDGAVQDLNVMTDRAGFDHDVVAMGAGAASGPGRLRMLVARVPMEVEARFGPVRLERLDALRLDPDETAAISAGAGWLVSLWHK